MARVILNPGPFPYIYILVADPKNITQMKTSRLIIAISGTAAVIALLCILLFGGQRPQMTTFVMIVLLVVTGVLNAGNWISIVRGKRSADAR